MRRLALLVAIPVAAVALGLAAPAAAGIFGGPPTSIPKPSKEYTATVVDQGGVSVRLSSVSWDGEVDVWGKLGAAEITVPFHNVSELKVLPAEDPDLRTVVVQTHHGGEVSLLVEHDVSIYGRTGYGNYRIEVADVRRMEIAPAP